MEEILKVDESEGPLKEGSSIRIGWTTFTIRSRGSELEVCEPDFDTDPQRALRPDITTSLVILVEQTRMVRRLAVDPIPAHYTEKVVFADGALGAHHVYMERSKEVSAGDSGWYVGFASTKTQGELRATYVYRLLKEARSLMSVLALPPGFLVVFLGGRIDSILDPQDNELWTNS